MCYVGQQRRLDNNGPEDDTKQTRRGIHLAGHSSRLIFEGFDGADRLWVDDSRDFVTMRVKPVGEFGNSDVKSQDPASRSGSSADKKNVTFCSSPIIEKEIILSTRVKRSKGVGSGGGLGSELRVGSTEDKIRRRLAQRRSQDLDASWLMAIGEYIENSEEVAAAGNAANETALAYADDQVSTGHTPQSQHSVEYAHNLRTRSRRPPQSRRPREKPRSRSLHSPQFRSKVFLT